MLTEFFYSDAWKLGIGPDLAWIRATSKRRRRPAALTAMKEDDRG